METTTIDLRDASLSEGATKLAEAFEKLSAGATQYFLSKDNPRSVIRELVSTHWGLFDWALLESDASGFLASIRKREQSGPLSLSELMGSDHRRCDELFAQAEQAAQAGDLEQATKLNGQYALGMEHHFGMEEEGFFAEFDRRMGMTGGGPVAVMREEHQQIRGMLHRMEEALNQSDLEDYLGAADTMLYLMEQHNMKEEQMLYPMADDAFGADMEELLKRLFVY